MSFKIYNDKKFDNLKALNIDSEASTSNVNPIPSFKKGWAANQFEEGATFNGTNGYFNRTLDLANSNTQTGSFGASINSSAPFYVHLQTTNFGNSIVGTVSTGPFSDNYMSFYVKPNDDARRISSISLTSAVLEAQPSNVSVYLGVVGEKLLYSSYKDISGGFLAGSYYGGNTSIVLGYYLLPTLKTECYLVNITLENNKLVFLFKSNTTNVSQSFSGFIYVTQF